MDIVDAALLFFVMIVAIPVNGIYLYGRLRPGRIGAATMNQYRAMQFLPLVLLLVLCPILYPSWARRHELMWLAQHGQHIVAQVTSVQESTHVRMNYRSPMVVYASWQDPTASKTYFFRSPNLWFDPRPLVSGTTIGVVLNPHDPSKYYMVVGPLHRTPPVAPSQQQLQAEVEQLKQQVSDLQNKQFNTAIKAPLFAFQMDLY